MSPINRTAIKSSKTIIWTILLKGKTRKNSLSPTFTSIKGLGKGCCFVSHYLEYILIKLWKDGEHLAMESEFSLQMTQHFTHFTLQMIRLWLLRMRKIWNLFMSTSLWWIHLFGNGNNSRWRNTKQNREHNKQGKTTTWTQYYGPKAFQQRKNIIFIPQFSRASSCMEVKHGC